MHAARRRSTKLPILDEKSPCLTCNNKRNKQDSHPPPLHSADNTHMHSHTSSYPHSVHRTISSIIRPYRSPYLPGSTEYPPYHAILHRHTRPDPTTLLIVMCMTISIHAPLCPLRYPVLPSSPCLCVQCLQACEAIEYVVR